MENISTFEKITVHDRTKDDLFSILCIQGERAEKLHIRNLAGSGPHARPTMLAPLAMTESKNLRNPDLGPAFLAALAAALRSFILSSYPGQSKGYSMGIIYSCP